jgi:hypothetical protein
LQIRASEHPSLGDPASILQIIPHGRLDILEFFERLKPLNINQQDGLAAVQALRSEGAISFDGATIQRPAQPSRRRLDPDFDQNWF